MRRAFARLLDESTLGERVEEEEPEEVEELVCELEVVVLP